MQSFLHQLPGFILWHVFSMPVLLLARSGKAATPGKPGKPGKLVHINF